MKRPPEPSAIQRPPARPRMPLRESKIPAPYSHGGASSNPRGGTAKPPCTRGFRPFRGPNSDCNHNLGQPLQRERRLRQRPHRQAHEHERVVVARDAVDVDRGAARQRWTSAHSPSPRTQTAMASIDAPQSALRSPGRCGCRGAGSTGSSDSGCGVGARRIRGYVQAAVATSEGVRLPAPDTRALIARQVGPPGGGYEKRKTASREGPGLVQARRRDVACSVAAVIRSTTCPSPVGRRSPSRVAARSRPIKRSALTCGALAAAWFRSRGRSC